MGRIQSSVGLITGIPIEETVEKLLAISARPRDLLIQRNEELRSQRVAVTELTALVIGVQFAIEALGTASLFEKKQVTTSDETLITATATGTPAIGSYQFTPVRQTQTHQLLSGGFSASDEPLGAGDLTFRFGGFLNKGLLLDELNGGAGVERGRIRITDRSGATAQIDLRFALTVDDVIQAINGNNDVNVTAIADGDRLRLVDNTGQTVSNLKVQEVGLGRAAADLGLAGIDVAAATAVGQDIVRLYDDLALSTLNDGNGVGLRKGVADLEITFQDGSTPLEIEFFAQTKGPTSSSATTDAANGVDAEVTFTSVGVGEEWDGYKIIFEDNEETTAGSETVEVDAVTKEIRFQIDAGTTRAVHIQSALNNDADASQLFTASLDSGNGTGVVDVDDTETTSGGAVEYANEDTVGEVLATINAADPARLRAQLSASGDEIELIDLTSGAGTFAVSSAFGGRAAEDLGFDTAAVAGQVTGRRRLGGLKTVLLDSLAGGFGLGTLGQLALTNRNGDSATVDLASAQTVSEVLDAINAANLGITAAVNEARNGIQLTDGSGGSGNLVVANADATSTADVLRIAVDDAVDSVDSGSLDLQTVSRQQQLSAFNNGRGVGTGSFLVTDSNGQIGAVNLRVSEAETIGDVIDLVNGLNIGVQARINDSGDGILLLDTAGGSGTLSVQDVGSGTAASDLKLTAPVVTLDINGTPTQTIDGSTTLRVSLDAEDTLTDLVTKINESQGDVAASLFNSGSGTRPYRLSIVSQIAGSAGELQIDASDIGISFQELAPAKDALLMVGPADAPIAGALAISSSNEFDSLIDGVTLSLHGTATSPVAINIEQTADPLASQLNLFVDQYNKLSEALDELTFFDEVENSTGVLFGSVEALRIEFDFANLLTDRFFGAGSIRSLEEIGLSLDGDGRLQFDEDKFLEKYASAPEALETFFTDETFGVAARFKAVGEQLAGEDRSLLLLRSESLQTTIQQNDDRIATLNDALDRERESLLEEFFRLETLIGRMQNNLSAVSQIQQIPPLFSTNQNR